MQPLAIQIHFRLWLLLFSAFAFSSAALMAQKSSGGNRKSAPQVDYPIVHVPKWQVNFSLKANEQYTVKMGGGALYHKPSWSINGTAILDSRMPDGSEPVIDPHADSNTWEGPANGSGSFSGEIWGEPSLGYKQIYAGGGSAPSGESSDNRMTFQVNAQEGTYEISFSIRLDGHVATDTSELKKQIEEIKSKAKSNDELGRELFQFLEGIATTGEKEGTKRFEQTITGYSFRIPLPASGQGIPTISGSKKVQNDVHEVVNGIVEGIFTWDIRPYDDSKLTKVTLDGCTELGVGQQGTVTAKGQPQGGSYRFWGEPSSTFRVAGQGSTANISGAEPGRGTLYVEYNAPGGKMSSTSQAATSLAVESINGGQAVPKIGLFNVEGKRADATLSVPVLVEPAGAGDLLVYRPADPAVLTAVSQGDSILLQGLREGKTTIQGATKCGGGTGPIVTVEVVPCDDEVKAKLAEEERILKETIKQVLEEDGRIRNSDEFTKLDMEKSTADFLIKTGGLIIGTLAGPKGTSAAVKTAADLYGAGTNLRDVLLEPTAESVGKATVQTWLQTLENAVPGLIADAYETIQAATKFGEDLGTLEGTAERLEGTRKWLDHWSQYNNDLQRRKKICQPKAEQPPKKDEPKPKPPTGRKPKPSSDPPPATAEPPARGESGSESGEAAGEQPGEPPSPPPPTSQRGPTGLPIEEEPGKCGCTKTAGTVQSSGPGLNAEGIADVNQGLRNLDRCTEQFNKGALSEFTYALDEWQILIQDIKTSATGEKAGMKEAIGKLVPRLDSVLSKTKEFDTAGHQFYAGFESCPAAVKGAVGGLSATPAFEAAKP